MKRHLFFLLLVALSASTYAQDVIVKKDGSTILSKVLEIGSTEVKYKKQSNLDGPTYTLSTADILSINYENGEKETFENAAANSNAGGQQGYVEKPADARNAQLLALFNKEYGTTKKLKQKDSPANYYSFILGVTSSSIMSNDEIEMSFRRESVLGSFGKEDVYYITLKNKTDKTIYIDKARSFRIGADGNSLCYFEDTEQTTVSVGKGSGASVGLGGIANALGVGGAVGQIANGVAVGGGTSQSVTTTYQQQRFIAIPPHGSRNLTEEKRVKSQRVEKAEDFKIEFEECGLSKGVVNVGEVKVFAENEVPWKTEYIIAYSTDEELRTYSTLKVDLYIHEVIGMFLPTMSVISDLDKKMPEYIDGITPNTIYTRAASCGKWR